MPEMQTMEQTKGFDYRPHLALLLCNIIWACDYPFYNIVLGHYVKPLAMVSASLVAAALLSWIPALWQRVRRSTARI